MKVYQAHRYAIGMPLFRYTLDPDSEMGFSFISTLAQEESHITDKIYLFDECRKKSFSAEVVDFIRQTAYNFW